MGAGAIGCYVGGRLLASGVDVVLVARAALVEELSRFGLRLTDLYGASLDVDAARLSESGALATDAAALAGCDVVIVTVKSGDTAAAGAALAPVMKEGAVVVSLQNGVSNPAVLREALPGRRVLAAMVPFNVLRKGEGRFHQGTGGAIAVEPGAGDLVAALVKAGLPAASRADIERVQWGKLVVNLNNVVNALAGVPIREMLFDIGYRRVMAAMVREALDVLDAAGVAPRLDPPLPPPWIPRMLTLPTALFRLAARPMLRVDPQARSSMWDDLQRGRVTEVDALNGAVVALARKVGAAAPINERLVALAKAAEGKGSPGLSAEALARALEPT